MDAYGTRRYSKCRTELGRLSNGQIEIMGTVEVAIVIIDGNIS